MNINYVMSNKTKSVIFSDINSYFKKYLKSENIFISEKPLKNMDIYHYHRPNLEKKLFKNSVVTVHHDLEDNDLALVQSDFIDRYNEANTIVCLNNTQCDILINKYKIDTNKIKIIPHGYNNDMFTNKKKQISFNKNNKITLGIFSRRYGRKVKGEAYLFELAKRLDKDRYNFLLVGKDRYKDKEMLEKLGFDCIAHEYIEYNQFNKLYYSIDFLLMISYFEGGPANIPEAFASGTPVISNNIGIPKDFIKENGIFLSMNPNIDIQIFEDIKNNKNNIFNKLQISAHNYQFNITWENNVLQYLDIYKSIKEKL